MNPFAFVFPGQGSQSVGMLDAWGDHPLVSEAVNEASEALGEDVGLLIKEGPKEALALTRIWKLLASASCQYFVILVLDCVMNIGELATPLNSTLRPV